MITERIPAIFFGTLTQSGSKRVKIDVGQTVDQGLSIFNN
jgi:hypothetical protein